MVCLLILIPFPSFYLTVLGLTTIILGLLEIGRTREYTPGLIAPGIALAVLSLKFFNFELIAYGIMIVGPIAAVLAYYLRSRRWEVGFGLLALSMLLLIVITSLDKRGLLTATVSGSVISLAVSAPRKYRPPAWLLFRSLVIALASLLIFNDHESLWLAYSPLIPGAVAIRTIGRVVLILLVPAALGLACLVEFLDKRRWAIASWIIVLVCLAEQGETTPTFDAAANRASIDRLASRIDRTRVTFYYHPGDGQPFFIHHLDAMWASLATGLPTVNGYSGHVPPSWLGFFRADFHPNIDISPILAEWERTYALPPDQVQWIARTGRK